MSTAKRIMHNATFALAVLTLAVFCNESAAQFQIGGPNGVVIGGGQGVRFGGPNGAQFGGGQGAKFGGPSGVQFGGGVGAKFGGPDGVQFGGGQGAKFGGEDGVQFGGGAGAKVGPLQASGRPAADRDVSDVRPETPPVMRPRPTTLHYPADAKKPLDFTLNDHPFTAKPDDTINLRGDRRWIIGFARGDGRGERRYALPPGDYTFKPSRTGWNLYRNKPARPTPELLPPPADVRRGNNSRSR